MKTIAADLLEDIVGTYDQTKTTTQGRIFEKTVNSNQVLGPPLNKFLDVFTDAAITPGTLLHATSNGRIFTVATEAGGLAACALYTVNTTTGAATYVGKINISLPDTAATTHTYRALKVTDTGTTGWKLYLGSTGTVTINGGIFLVNNIDLADFVPVGSPTIPFATGNNQKAVYDMQDPAFVGSAHLQIATAGAVLDQTNNRLYCHNGVAATNQWYVFDTSVSPTYTTNAITGTEATNTINDAGHVFVNNDPVTFTALTGGAGFTVGTTYFVVGAVAGVSYQLSATSGGAAINFTTDISAGTIGRAFGTSTSNFLHKTGNMLPALTGTLLLTDSEDYAMPVDAPVSVSGFPCAFFATTTNLYLGRLSELTSGATAWPSLQTVNLLGTANQITAPTAVQAAWSNTLDRSIYSTNTSIFIKKRFVNNEIENIFGGIGNQYFEGVVTDVVPFQMTAVTALDIESGFMFVSTLTVGQRGIYTLDLRSNEDMDYSYIVTKVLDLQPGVLNHLSSTDELFAFTGSLTCYYRTSGFGSISGGWIEIPFSEDISAFASGSQIQFKIAFDTLGLDTCIHAQLAEFYLTYDSYLENSDHWEISKDLSSTGGTPKVVGYLAQAYDSGTVPTIYARATQQGTSTSVGSANTSANPTQFRYSTNNGVSWNTLGTIPNVVGTLIEWTISPAPTVDYLPTFKES